MNVFIDLGQLEDHDEDGSTAAVEEDSCGWHVNAVFRHREDAKAYVEAMVGKKGLFLRKCITKETP